MIDPERFKAVMYSNDDSTVNGGLTPGTKEFVTDLGTPRFLRTLFINNATVILFRQEQKEFGKS